MSQKGQQVETEHKSREVLHPVPKGVFDMVALGFEHVVVFVFDLPAPTPRSGDLCDTFIGQRMSGEKAVVLELLTRFAMDERYLKPMDRQGPATAS
jgi:hypothetical protein